MYILKNENILKIVALMVLYDAVNRNKVSIHQLPFIFLSHSLHVSAPTGHPQVRYIIVLKNSPSNIYLYISPEDGPWGPKHVVSEKGK
jgi:Mg2+/citrate symporter